MPDPLDQLLQDVEVDAESRELAGYVYRAALDEGQTEDVALDMAALALGKLRGQWGNAKQEDER